MLYFGHTRRINHDSWPTMSHTGLGIRVQHRKSLIEMRSAFMIFAKDTEAVIIINKAMVEANFPSNAIHTFHCNDCSI